MGSALLKLIILIINRMNEVMFFFSIKCSDILLNTHKLHLSRLFCCNHTCYCFNMVSVTSASRYQPRYQSRSSMYIRRLIPRTFADWPRLFRSKPRHQLIQSFLSTRRKRGPLATYWVKNEASDQLRRLPRLIWVFARRTLIFLGLSWHGSLTDITEDCLPSSIVV